MTDSSSNSFESSHAAPPETAAWVYRCVCGTCVEVDPQSGAHCPHCGRRVHAEIVSRSTSATVASSAAVGLEATQERTTPGPTDACDERVGQRWGHYRIWRRLGSGGMGTVYQALDESLQRDVALKVIQPTGSAATDSRSIQRLLEEAIAQARVNHPNVVHIYYVGREGRLPFLAMELVPGISLADQLKHGPLPFDRVIAIALQVVDALRHCVRFDIVHGDIKPANILLADARTVKLSDFGLARRLSQVDQHSGLLAGTPMYLAPEVAEVSAPDIRGDMYSLGVTLFEMTFGRLPYEFSGTSLFDYLTTHRTAAIEFPDPWPSELPIDWRDVLVRLMAKKPEMRYESYDQLLGELRRLQPVVLPKAGRVQRGLAWMVDLGLVSALQQLFYGSLSAGSMAGFWRSHPLLQLATALAGGAAPLAAAAVQARWKTTPGKQLFQLQIVDRHGLVPPQSILIPRAFVQMLPLCAATVYHVLNALHLTPLGDMAVAAATLALAADVVVAVVRRDGRSLHDQLFGTRVVLQSQDRMATPSAD